MTFGTVSRSVIGMKQLSNADEITAYLHRAQTMVQYGAAKRAASRLDRAGQLGVVDAFIDARARLDQTRGLR